MENGKTEEFISWKITRYLIDPKVGSKSEKGFVDTTVFFKNNQKLVISLFCNIIHFSNRQKIQTSKISYI
jgi:hypothetical protein